MLIARYAEIEAEAKRRGVDPDVLTTRLEQAIACRFGAVPTPDGQAGREPQRPDRSLREPSQHYVSCRQYLH
jgi:hypothetical protein